MGNRTAQTGFTLMELIAVIAIVGILAIAVIPRFTEVNALRERGAADQVRAALRFAQKVAIAQNRVVTVTIGNAADERSDCPIGLDATSNVTCNISSLVVIPAAAFAFSGLGRETGGGGGINVGGEVITVEAETGYVH